VDHRDDVRGVGRKRAAELVRIAGASPFDRQPRHRGAVPLEHLRETIAEIAADHDERACARFGEVRDRRFHARRARA
jgi:hypothetical protein